VQAAAVAAAKVVVAVKHARLELNATVLNRGNTLLF
jgi:hypothetical protein